MKGTWLSALAAAVACAAIVAVAAAQRRGSSGGGGHTDFEANNVPYDGRFTFVRLRYTPLRAGRPTRDSYFDADYFWDHDYPRADQHVTTILRELTNIEPSRGYNILSVGSRELFKYPVSYMSEPGLWGMSDSDAVNLRAYLLKGGFMILDDFAQGWQLANFEQQLRRVLPDARVVQLDASHPIFHSFFEINALNFQHPYYGAPSAFLGVFEDNDPSKRLLLIANYNNDVGESWEWSDTGYFPVDVTNEAYKLGLNYFVYSMTH